MSYNKFTPQQVIAVLQDNDTFKKDDNKQTQVKLSSLYLTWVRIPNIIDYLSLKAYTKLKALSLSGNNIETLQPISMINMPLI